MKLRSASELVRGLEKRGLHFRKFAVESTGRWSVADADWNYKDVPHLNVVHSLAQTVPATIGDDIITTVNLQRIAGLLFPIALANYVAPDGSQVYFTTLGVYVLIVETRIDGLTTLDAGKSASTRVVTTYHVGGPRLPMLLFPVLRRLLSSNYQVLMSEDLPMRERRGRLRDAGYSFVSDGRARTFMETVDLTVANVVPPNVDDTAGGVVDLSPLQFVGGSVVLGAGPSGYRLVRSGSDVVRIYDRVCPHEGACLDEAMVSEAVVVCPWHGKRVKAIAEFALGAESNRIDLGGGRGLEIDEMRCRYFGFP